MCGLVGYVGKKNSKQLIIDALSKLQYRGHDGAGFACINNEKKISSIKEHGTLELLKKKLLTYSDDGLTAIGHIRWASVGQPSIVNAHPQLNQTNSIAFVHGGNIENYKELKHNLIKQGHLFDSQTDTQIVPYLLDTYLSDNNNLEIAIKKLMQTLHGSFALVGLTEQYPDTLITIRRRSPLAILVDDDGIRVSSDFRAIGRQAKNKGFFQPNQTFCIVSPDELKLYAADGTLLPFRLNNIEVNAPVYESNALGKMFNNVEDHLKNFLSSIFPDRLLPEKSDEFIALVNAILSGRDLHVSEQKYVQATLKTLEHLQDGTYGLCFNCGQPISEKVLSIHPQMSLCYRCNERFEACA